MVREAYDHNTEGVRTRFGTGDFSYPATGDPTQARSVSNLMRSRIRELVHGNSEVRNRFRADDVSHRCDPNQGRSVTTLI